MAALKWGAKGSAVKALQLKLNKAGAKPKIPVDAVFGEKTYTALKAFQKATPGLRIDGVAGAKTLAAFEPKPAAKPDTAKKKPGQAKAKSGKARKVA